MEIPNDVFEEQAFPEAFEQQPGDSRDNLVQPDARSFPDIVYRLDVDVTNLEVVLVEFDQQIVWHTVVFVDLLRFYAL